MTCARLGGAGSCCLGSVNLLCATARGTSIPAAKTGTKITIPELTLILKTINRSEFVNLLANLHHRMCKPRTESTFGAPETALSDAAGYSQQAYLPLSSVLNS